MPLRPHPRALILLALAGCTHTLPPPGTGADDSGSPPVEDTGSADGCRPAEGAATADAWGGDTRAELDASGAFRVEELCGRWWFVSPEGHPMWSLGVNALAPWGEPDQVTGAETYAETVAAVYGDADTWADATVPRLAAWGFNTAGSWSDTAVLLPRMPTTINLDLSGDDWQTGALADYFDSAWQAQVEERVASRVQPDAPNLVGYFLDNEVRWGPDWRSIHTLLQDYMALPAEAPGKQAAVALLLDQAGGLAGVNALLGTRFADDSALLAATDGFDALAWPLSEQVAPLESAFLRQVAERYFQVTVGAVRAADPVHLVLGNREVSVMTRAEVYEAAAPLVDVISVNRYTYADGLEPAALNLSGSVDPGTDLQAIHDLTGRPVLVTEFGFRAADSGLPNSWPPVYPTYDTQEDRADAFEEQVRAWQQAPWIVGYHWYRWVDDPPLGRFDGEDNNWGLIDVADQPYEVMDARTAVMGAEVAQLLRVPEDAAAGTAKGMDPGANPG